MDLYKFKDPHQYGAFLFVQWLVGSSSLLSQSGWDFLKDSFVNMGSQTPTLAVKAALSDDLNEQMGDELASFWGDHTNQVPSFGPRGAMKKTTVDQPYQQLTANPAQPLAGGLGSIVPGSKVEQIELK